MKTGHIPVDGGSVIYRTWGEDKPGIPVIFLHGGPGSSCYYFFKQCVLGENRPIVFYNQLGSAGSDVSDEYTTAEEVKKLFTVEHFVEELESVVKYFDFDEFVILGHSWGCMLAIEYAAHKKPEGLKGIILSGPYLRTETWVNDAERLMRSLPDGDAIWDHITECEEKGEYDAEYERMANLYLDNFYSRIPGAMEGTPKEPDTKVVDGISVYEYMWGRSDFSGTGTLHSRDSTPLLKEVEVPILYLAGEYDNGTPEASVFYRSFTPNGEICVLPGCAHDLTRERPEEFNAVVEAFLRRI
ncbi:MAG: proline iminopeptidase-family hydrolase [Clostridiales bacterium]|nr:proline iminopeptidase-family hydrolase [Clostridiales bacterium]